MRIHGLKGRSDLNGKCGTIVQLVQSKGRWVVRLDSHTFDNYATAYPILKYGGDGGLLKRYGNMPLAQQVSTCEELARSQPASPNIPESLALKSGNLILVDPSEVAPPSEELIEAVYRCPAFSGASGPSLHDVRDGLARITALIDAGQGRIDLGAVVTGPSSGCVRIKPLEVHGGGNQVGVHVLPAGDEHGPQPLPASVHTLALHRLPQKGTRGRAP